MRLNRHIWFLGIWLSIGGIFIGLDQYIKKLAIDSLKSGFIKYGTDVFGATIELHENPGAFLSLGAELNEITRQTIFLIGVAVILIFVAIVWYRLWLKNQVHSIMWFLILLGGVGNLIDRLTNAGRVVDYITLSFLYLHTGVFNLADVAITAGVIGLFLIASKCKSDH